MQVVRFLAGIFFILISFTLYAQWSEPILSSDSDLNLPAEESLGKYESMDEESAESSFDRSRNWVANSLNVMSHRMDEFFSGAIFGDDILDEYYTGTRARLAATARHELDYAYNTSYKINGSVRWALPHTNERFNLLFQADDGDESDSDRNLETGVEPSSYSAALRYVIKEGSAWKTDTDLGVRWEVPPNPYARVRARRDVYLSEWSWRFISSLSYYTYGGWEQENDIRFDYPINTEKLFRIHFSTDYWVSNDYVDLKYSFTLFHELSPKSVLAYSAGAFGSTQYSLEFQEYFAELIYKRLIYKDWVYFSINPRFEWHQDDYYKTLPVIVLKLEALIF